ncbi:MAG: TRAP transporter small permease [Pseudomonadota bacterium]
MKTLGLWHDATSRGLFALAGAALCLVVALYAFEVVARYFFDAPTTWSGEAVQYSLAVLLFCALPDVTRKAAHVAIDIIPEALSETSRRKLAVANNLLASCVTALSGWIVAGEALNQLNRGLLTNAAHPIPRWWLTAIIAIGLFSASLHFLRHGLEQKP